MTRLGGWATAAPFVFFGLTTPGCGSSKATAAPTAVSTPTPTPVPTPTPRQTASLDAPADYVHWTPTMARITSPQAFEFQITPKRANDPYPSVYHHGVEVWLNSTIDVDDPATLAFGMSWTGNASWLVGYYTPATKWYLTRTRFDVGLGSTATIRVIKHASRVVEVQVNGVSVVSVEDPELSRTVRLRTVGMAADVSWIPTGLAGSSEGGKDPFGLCLFCAPVH